MLVGAGALQATDEVIEVADLLGAGVAKALLGKAVLPDDVSLLHGVNRTARDQAELGHDDGMRHAADGRLELSVLGVSARRKARRVACRSTLDPKMVSIRYPMEVNLIGDSAETLRALMPLLERKDGSLVAAEIGKGSRGLVEGARSARDEQRRSDQPRARFLGAFAASAGQLHSRLRLRFVRQLVRARSENPPRHDGVAFRQSGDDVSRCALRDRGEILLSRSPVIALVGDGAMQMLGNNGLITIAKYWKEWSDPRLIFWC